MTTPIVKTFKLFGVLVHWLLLLNSHYKNVLLSNLVFCRCVGRQTLYYFGGRWVTVNKITYGMLKVFFKLSEIKHIHTIGNKLCWANYMSDMYFYSQQWWPWRSTKVLLYRAYILQSSVYRYKNCISWRNAGQRETRGTRWMHSFSKEIQTSASLRLRIVDKSVVQFIAWKRYNYLKNTRRRSTFLAKASRREVSSHYTNFPTNGLCSKRRSSPCIFQV
jgi:hypothetical protein